MRLLLVEDNVPLADELVASLSRNGYAIDWLADGRDAEYQGASEPYDLIILDLGLPGKPGLEVLRAWRAGGLTTPVLILTARGSWAERIDGLKAGADDYLTKPFSACELLARMRAIMRRAESRNAQPAEIQAGELFISLARRHVSLKGEEISLTRTEFGILALLVQNIDCVVTYRMLSEKLWDDKEERDTQLLRVHVSNLRKKVEPNPALPRFIHTEPGIGFRFTPE